jgi:prepilin-type N-terminal cleavage/methylation domain-containing protein
MKTQKRNEVQAKRAFTLIEMIGVLAVIAILAALLIPKIFEAINNARVNNALVSYNTVKTAVMDHYAKYGGIDRSTNNVILVGTGLTAYDHTLLTEGFLDKPFLTKIGSTSWVQVVAANLSQYDLDGDGNIDTTNGASYVVEAIIAGVPGTDARDVNDRLDGSGAPFTWANPDTKGRVKYDGTNLDIYITHR